MNGYDLIARHYAAIADEDEQKREEYMRLASLYGMLASLTETDVCALVDSGAFNALISGYALLCMEHIGKERGYTEREAKALAKDMKEAMRALFESVSAGEVVRFITQTGGVENNV